MSWAASLPGAELFLKNRTFFEEEATCPGQLRCLGQNFFSEIRLFLKKPLVPGSFAAWGRTFFSQKIDFFFDETTCPGQLRCLGQDIFQKTFFLKKPLVPGSFAAWGRTVSQNMILLEQTTCPGQLRCLGQNFLLEQCVFFLTSHLSWAASLPGAELFLKKRTFMNSGTPVRRTRRRKSQKCTFRNSGTPMRRTRRRKSQKMHIQEF